MTIMDMAECIPDEELDRIRRDAEGLERSIPYNERGEKINWFEALVRDWWRNNQAMPNGWFQWWDD